MHYTDVIAYIIDSACLCPDCAPLYGNTDDMGAVFAGDENPEGVYCDDCHDELLEPFSVTCSECYETVATGWKALELDHKRANGTPTLCDACRKAQEDTAFAELESYLQVTIGRDRFKRVVLAAMQEVLYGTRRWVELRTLYAASIYVKTDSRSWYESVVNYLRSYAMEHSADSTALRLFVTEALERAITTNM